MITAKDKIIALLEEVIQENERYLHAVVMAAPIILFALDNEGVCTLLEGKGLAVLGLKAKEIIGKSIYDLCGSEPVVLDVFKRCIGGEEVVKTVRFKQVWLEVQVTPHYSETKKPDGVIGVAVDVTWRKQVEEELVHKQKILEHSEKNLKKFSRKLLAVREEEKKKLSINLHDELSAMSVDLSSKLDISMEDIKNDNPADALEILEQTRQALKNSVSRLKRLAVDLMPPHLDKVQLGDILRDYIANIRKQMNFRISFRSELGDKKLKEETAITLYRVVQESLTNVVKHADAERVRIRLYFSNKRIKLDISDDGKGFNMKSLRDIDELKMGIRGMRERTEAIGGSFAIESMLGGGTTIRIII